MQAQLTSTSIYQCDICGHDFHSATEWHAHITSNVDHPQCTRCNRTFPDDDALRLHYRQSIAHNWCDVCERDFMSAFALGQHRRHSPEHRANREARDATASVGAGRNLRSTVGRFMRATLDKHYWRSFETSLYDFVDGMHFLMEVPNADELDELEQIDEFDSETSETSVGLSTDSGEDLESEEEDNEVDDSLNAELNPSNESTSTLVRRPVPDTIAPVPATEENEAQLLPSHTVRSTTNHDARPPIEDMDNVALGEPPKPSDHPRCAEPGYTCPLCLEAEGELSSIACGHVFCTPCIQQALLRKRQCPVCRAYSRRRDVRRIYLCS